MFKEMITTQIIFLFSSFKFFVKFTIYYMAKKNALVYSFLVVFF